MATMRSGDPSIRGAGRAGFTLMESLTALGIMAVAGTALVAGVTSGVETAEYAVESQMAQGLAAQMFDEIAACRYCDATGSYNQSTLGPEAGETSGASRVNFDDIDDYAGLVEQPPKDRFGIALGTENGSGATRHANFVASANYFNNWRREVSVVYVSAADLTTTSASPTAYRAVDVKIYRVDPLGNRLIVSQRRVFAYVPRP